MTTVADVRERMPLKELNDEEIASPLTRAIRDFRDKVFKDDSNNYDRVEAVACLAIYYIAPLLWLRIQNRANQYDETMETFKDVEVFQNYWKERSESIPYTIELDETPESNKMGHIGMGVA